MLVFSKHEKDEIALKRILQNYNTGDRMFVSLNISRVASLKFISLLIIIDNIIIEFAFYTYVQIKKYPVMKNWILLFEQYASPIIN